MSSFTLEELAQLQKSTLPRTKISPTPQTEKPTNAPSPEDQKLILKNRNKSGLDYFEEYSGGRESIIDSLQLSPLDKKQQYFLELLLDPQRASDSLNLIARDAGLTSTQAQDLLRSASFARSHALGLAKLNEKLPEVAADLADKSVDTKVQCPHCFGEKYISEGVTCGVCNGKGEIFRGSDLDRQKILLEATGVIKKGGGVNVNVQQNVGVMQPGAFFSKFVKDSDAAAYSTDVVDAEIVKDGK